VEGHISPGADHSPYEHLKWPVILVIAGLQDGLKSGPQDKGHLTSSESKLDLVDRG